MPIQKIMGKGKVPVKIYTEDVEPVHWATRLCHVQSPRDDVFIVRGKGNPQSFCSCSHGAGRRMSRTAAKRKFDQRIYHEPKRSQRNHRLFTTWKNRVFLC